MDVPNESSKSEENVVPWERLDIFEQKRILEERTGFKCPLSDEELRVMQQNGQMLTVGPESLSNSDYLALGKRMSDLLKYGRGEEFGPYVLRSKRKGDQD